jgi:hypothetical protein
MAKQVLVMDASAERDLYVSHHEAGHCMIAHLRGWPASITIVGGTALAGCSPVNAPPRPIGNWLGSPLWEWPLEARLYQEGMAMLFLAGDLAEDFALSRPTRGQRPARARRRGPSVAEEAAEIAAELPPPTATEREHLTAAVSDKSLKSDAEHVARIAAEAHPDLKSRVMWIMYMRSATAEVIARREFEIRRLATDARGAGLLGSAAVAAILGPRDPA